MPSPAHNASMVESERNFTFNFGGFVSEPKSPPLYFSGLIVGVLRDVGAGGGAGETKPTEPAWMKGILKGRMPLCLAPHSCERGFPGDTTRRCRIGLDALRRILRCMVKLVSHLMNIFILFYFIFNVIEPTPALREHETMYRRTCTYRY